MAQKGSFWYFDENLVDQYVLLAVENECSYGPLSYRENHVPGKNMFLKKTSKSEKVAEAVGGIGSKINVLSFICSFVH